MVPAVAGDEGDDRSGPAMTGCGRMMDEMAGHDGNSNELKKLQYSLLHTINSVPLRSYGIMWRNG